MPSRPRMRRRRLRLTGRGVALLSGGAILMILGIVLGLPDFVGLGTGAATLVILSGLWMSLSRLDRGRAALGVARQITPHPTVRGKATTARLLVSAINSAPMAMGRLSRLRISEQTSRELCDQRTLRAQMVAAPGQIAVRYQLRPLNRGRWTLGPLMTSRTDIFGVVRVAQPLGAVTRVSVWPRTVELPVRGWAHGERDRTGTGTALSSPDDSALREYVAGDDLRRVHWVSAARQGQLMVRVDESAGMATCTVLLDRGLLDSASHPQTPSPAAEWPVECAASVALSFLHSGHPVRFVATSPHPEVDTPYVSGNSPEATAQILNETLDLCGYHDQTESQRALVATGAALVAHTQPSDLLIAVIGPQSPAGRSALAALAQAGYRWAILVAQPTEPAMVESLEQTEIALRASGWRVTRAHPATAVQTVWERVMEQAR